jgi:hypothetical protein
MCQPCPTLSTLQNPLRQPWSLPVTCLLPCPHLGYTGTTQLLHRPGETTQPQSHAHAHAHAHAHQNTFIQGCRIAMWYISVDILKACVTTHYLTSRAPRSH